METLARPAVPIVHRVRVERVGRVSHDAATELQADALRRVLEGGGETVFLLEHEPVYTLGRNASAADVLLSPERLSQLGVALRETDRGGKVTYHGPGQLVGYPVLNLSPDRRDVKRYVTDLEDTLIRTLADWGIRGTRSTRPERVTSVWVGDDKVAAIGVHLSRWITTHGFALNVTDEPLPFFGGIVPCGIVDGGVTSMERLLGRRLTLDEVADAWLAHFGEVFGREIIGS
ncbi:MAG TPA: lipoyl(octanoyl) transferase LipB [Thermoanaerobaculia bacterium]|nr:lipoyl(octanoyl) transferase LipB [Thermoanaerobaculia bacterium]